MLRRKVLLALSLISLSACAPQLGQVASASRSIERPTWAFETSDIPVDPAYKFGRLANGMRYVIRQNATPKGTALVRMEIAAGALDEADGERGFAHFVEHMAFNGSANVPEGEMVKLLEREGLAFGADNNASTGFEQTTYMLDLPRNDPALLGTALMLMRETASELKFAPDAVSRERGVILAELRDSNTWQRRNLEAQFAFSTPGARYTQRLPIGIAATLNAATAQGLKSFWERHYVPAKTTLVVIGDFAPDAVEAAIKARFDSWQAAPALQQPEAGPVDLKRSGETAVYIDQAMSERISASRHRPWVAERDSVAQRRENMLRQIAYGIINRRLQRMSRQPDPPFRDAGLGTGDVFESARTTNLVVDTVDGKWRRGVISAAVEYRRALRFGFTAAEVAEQIANLRTSIENQAASADTRSHLALLNGVFSLIRDDLVPTTPTTSLARFRALAPSIKPKGVLAALRREAAPLIEPLLRLQGRRAPEGGAAGLRAAWDEAMRQPLVRERRNANASFGYTSFGAPGIVVSDSIVAALGIRTLRFANGLALNLKRTALEKDRIGLQLAVDGGMRLNTRDDPLATEMVSSLPAGGLGKHSQDELQSILAGRTLGYSLDSTADAFVSSAQTTRRDLELQLQLFSAMISDPGYRPEGELRYRLNINNFFAQLRATPQSSLSAALGGILSDNDPRFTLQKVEDFRKLSFAGLRTDIADRLTKGALELGIVGDIDEQETIALVGRTLGALPAREEAFADFSSQPPRLFTTNRAPRTLRHTGPKDQALLRLTWPTRDDRDPAESIALELLERVVQIELTETLREKLGQTYSPSAGSSASRHWQGYGTFAITASIDVGQVGAVRAAMAETLARLRAVPISIDELQRARQPMIEAQENALKANRGWLSLTARAQSEADKIDRFVRAKERLLAVSPTQLQALAARYLGQADGLEVLVLPDGVEP